MKSPVAPIPPKHRFAHRSGSEMRPMSVPAGVQMVTPFFLLAAPPAAPEVARRLAAHAVGDSRLAVDEITLPVGELRPFDDVEDTISRGSAPLTTT